MSASAGYKTILIEKSFWLFTGRAMPVVVLFFITILYSRQLSYEDYGKFQSVWMYTNLLNVIISFGVTSMLFSSNLLSLTAFIKRHFIKIISSYGLLLTLTIFIFSLFGKNFTTTTKGLLIFFVLIQSISAVLETMLIKSNKEKIVMLINFFYSLLFFGWHYYILLRAFNLNNLISGITIISIAKLIIMFFFRQKQDGVIELTDDKVYFKHWIYLGLNDVTGVVSRWIDKLLLIYLLTAADFALFFNGSFEIPLFGLLISVVGSVMLIEMSNNTSTKEKVMQLFKESFNLLSSIVFPLFLFLLFFRTELFAIIFKHKYDASIPIFLISIFILPLRINNYSSILQYYQQGNKIMHGSLLDICLALLLMVLLYPLLGTRGVALAIVIATYCQVWYYLWQSAKVLHTNILSLIPVKALTLSFTVMLLLYACLYYTLYKFTIEARLITGMIVTTIVVLVSLYFYFTKKTLNVNGLTK